MSRVLRVANLPKYTTNDDVLSSLNRTADRLVDARVLRDPANDSECLGYGYLHFETAHDALNALAKYQGKYIAHLGYRFQLSVAQHFEGFSLDSFQLYLGALPAETTNADLYALLKQHSDQVRKVHIVTDERGVSRGYGFVQFESDEAARKALSKLSMLDTPFIFRDTHTPSRAEMDRGIDHLHNTVIFIGNLNLNISDTDLKEALSRFGFVQLVRIVAGKGFGFVEFGDHVSALAALSELQNSELFHQRVYCTWGQMRGGTFGQQPTIRPDSSDVGNESLEHHASLQPQKRTRTDTYRERISTKDRVKLLEESLKRLGADAEEFPNLKSLQQINDQFILDRFSK
jgi:RNA recognition motif-containing protein